MDQPDRINGQHAKGSRGIADRQTMAADLSDNQPVSHQTAGTVQHPSEPPEMEKLKVVKQMVASMAHEMNNVLATIMGLASVIEAEIHPESLITHDVQGILAAVRRGLGLTRNVLSFAQEGERNKEFFSLNHIVSKTKSLLQQSLPQHVEIQTDLATKLPEMEGDMEQIKYLLLNLATNAADAIHNKGTLTFKTREVTFRRDDTPGGMKPGTYVRLQVMDTGSGMDTETVEKVFDPFYSTKPPSTAVGLGLSLVYSTVRQHEGKISVFSRKGLGTTVTIYFPAAKARPAQLIATVKRKEKISPGSKTILLLDDEMPLLISTKRLLEKIGYSVLTAASGQEGLACYRENKPHISLVIVDLIMPEMDGMEVFAKLKELDPQVRVIFYTGYVTDKVKETILTMGAVGFLQKPFTRDHLIKALEDALSASDSLP